MTTVAWDGKTLAADKRATIGGTRTTITKLRRGKGGNLVGVSGTASLMEAIFAWLCDGGKKPEAQEDRSDWCGVIEIDPDGRCFKHERWGKFQIEAPYFAVGSGSDLALAAMSLGCDAAKAVEVASQFDTASGDGVDALHLAAAKPAKPAKAPRRATVGPRLAAAAPRKAAKR